MNNSVERVMKRAYPLLFSLCALRGLCVSKQRETQRRSGRGEDRQFARSEELETAIRAGLKEVADAI